MVRNIAGHGCLRTRKPPESGGTVCPCLLTTSAITPGKGRVAEPGFVGIAPGNGVISIIPVSVCHQVSTIGHRPRPITSLYHIHASGLIGSPTVPSSLKLFISYRRGHCSPHFMKARSAVGAVYRMLTLCRSMILQKRSGSGQLGAPSYIVEVAPFCRGP